MKSSCSAPRSGARKLARGTRFVRTPGIGKTARGPTLEGWEESSTPTQGARFRLSSVFQGYAKNAYPWLISLHRSAVLLFLFIPTLLFAQTRGAPPRSPKDGALIDPTGYWVAIVSEDWRFRM